MTALTVQERAALTLTAMGYTSAAGAKRLRIGTRTFQRLLVSAEKKLNANCRTNAVAKAITRRLITLDPDAWTAKEDA